MSLSLRPNVQVDHCLFIPVQSISIPATNRRTAFSVVQQRLFTPNQRQLTNPHPCIQLQLHSIPSELPQQLGEFSRSFHSKPDRSQRPCRTTGKQSPRSAPRRARRARSRARRSCAARPPSTPRRGKAASSPRRRSSPPATP